MLFSIFNVVPNSLGADRVHRMYGIVGKPTPFPLAVIHKPLGALIASLFWSVIDIVFAVDFIEHRRIVLIGKVVIKCHKVRNTKRLNIVHKLIIAADYLIVCIRKLNPSNLLGMALVIKKQMIQEFKLLSKRLTRME